MSTKITDIYNALVDLVTATFPDAQRLPDPEQLENNEDAKLRRGFGIAIGPGVNTNRNICPNYTLARKFTVVLSREAPAKDSDWKKKDEAKLTLLEDLHLLLAAVVDDLTLSETAHGIQFESDGRPEELAIDDKPYLFLEATFNVEYFQSV